MFFMNTPRKPTQADIARLAGLTRVTVNRALTNNPDVAPETRRRVREIADRIGYRPHIGARAMREGRYGSVSLVVGATFNIAYLPPSMLTGVQQGAAQNDYKLSVDVLDYDAPPDDNQVADILRVMATDGLVIDDFNRLPNVFGTLLKRHNIPAVWLNRYEKTDCVCPDDIQGAAWATSDVLKRGHTRVAYANIGMSGHFSMAHRWMGYSDTMTDAGLKPVRLQLGHEQDEIDAQFIELMHHRDAPTAFVTYEGKEAEALYIAACKNNISVPRDLSIVALSAGGVICGCTRITTYAIPFKEVGSAGVDMLMKKIANPVQTFPLEVYPYSFLSSGNTLVPPPQAS